MSTLHRGVTMPSARGDRAQVSATTTKLWLVRADLGLGQCDLTELQTNAIRGLAGLFNASCNYNTSITEVLSD